MLRGSHKLGLQTLKRKLVVKVLVMMRNNKKKLNKLANLPKIQKILEALVILMNLSVKKKRVP